MRLEDYEAQHARAVVMASKDAQRFSQREALRRQMAANVVWSWSRCPRCGAPTSSVWSYCERCW